MVFSSLIFIFIFLPLVLISYYVAPKRLRNTIILLASLIFYAWGEPIYIVLIIISILINYLGALLIRVHINNKEKSKFIFITILLIDISILFFFKYYGFAIESLGSIIGLDLKVKTIALPLGISFYTFQQISYISDIYMKKTKPQRNLIDFAAYITMFPQLVAGPIVKYTDINKQLSNRKESINKFGKGVQRFIIGLGKKVILANNLGLIWSQVKELNSSDLSVILAWIGIIAFTLQIYFDFSGYSLMAIGLGKILGFNFPINFNYPYESKSISEFWRRWHITLGQWFKEYVYIPLGGNRVRKVRLYFNLFIVWFLTGFWHGASYNFILWGLYFFLLISIEKAGLLKFLNNNKFISHIYAIFFILIGWVLFAVVDLAQIKLLFKQMFSFNIGNEWIYYLRNYAIVFIIAIIFSTSFPKKLYKKFIKNDVIDTVIILMIFLVSIAYLVDSSYNPFLYFRF